MGNTSQELLADLEKTYCPAIDSALFAAIAYDYDLNVPGDVSRLREALDEIKGLAVAQEHLPFDPSGTANNQDVDPTKSGAMASEPGMSAHGCDESLYTTTDITSLSDDSLSRAVGSNSKSHAAYTVEADGSLKLTGATHADKVETLMEMFPTTTQLDVDQTLKKSNDDVDKAMDILLNLSFFGETQDASDDIDAPIFVPRGIDGFNAEQGDVGRQTGRKKRRNKKQKQHLVDTAPSDSPVVNKWEVGKADIDFICSRAVDVSSKKVNSAYHANGMLLPATIQALALAESPQHVNEIIEDPVMSAQVTELSQDYPAIPQTTLIGLLKITRNIISATSELAAVMIQQPQSSANAIIKFTTSPLNLEDDESAADYQSHYQGAASTLNYEQARAAADVHFAARSSAYEQASRAARLARSNPLYGGAVAVYHERGQEQRQLAMQQLATASDRLVDRQSSQCDLDLHGVTVPNAIRITRERVEVWWHALGDTKHIRGGGKHVHGGFKVVTGVGNHSADGTSRLGPAVSKMLMREGWRVEVDRGCLLVTGKARR